MLALFSLVKTLEELAFSRIPRGFGCVKKYAVASAGHFPYTKYNLVAFFITSPSYFKASLVISIFL